MSSLANPPEHTAAYSKKRHVHPVPEKTHQHLAHQKLNTPIRVRLLYYSAQLAEWSTVTYDPLSVIYPLIVVSTLTFA
jgi:hypothetical protein